MDRIKAEIFYVAEKISKECPEQKIIRFADPNYGMFKRDIEISSYMGETQKLYQWPLIIDATTGKNQAENIIKSIEQVNGALLMYQAVQSLDEEVLQNVKRKNIKLQTYEDIQMYILGRGLRSTSDLILGLPGESLQSHLDSIMKTANAGTSRINNFQALLLKGSEMEMIETREKYDFTTKFRLGPKNFGEYNDENVFDVDEIVVANSTMSFDDYLKARIHHFVISVFWNESRFTEVIDFIEKLGFKKWDFIRCIYEYLMTENHIWEEFKGDFLRETNNELFGSEKELVEFYGEPENFEKVKQSLIGDNLIYKYRAIASFWRWEETCKVAFAAVHQLIAKSKSPIIEHPDFNLFWSEWQTFTTHRYAYGETLEQLLSDDELAFNFNFENLQEIISSENLMPTKQKIHCKMALSKTNGDNLKQMLSIMSYSYQSIPMVVKKIHNDWRIKEITVSVDKFKVASIQEPV